MTAGLGNTSNIGVSQRYGDSVLSNTKRLIPMRTPGRNRLINGDFQVMQRSTGGTGVLSVAGTTSAATTLYTHDRWQLQASANQTASSRQIAGTTDARMMAQIDNITGGGQIRFAQCLIADQAIGVATYPLSLSFWAMCGSNFSSPGGLLTVRIYSGTNTTDVSNLTVGFSGLTVVLNTTIQLTTSPAFFSFNNLVTTAGLTQLSLEFSYVAAGTPATALTDNFILGNVQLEQSPNVTPFEHKYFVNVLNECEFFYQKSYAYSIAPATNNATNGVIALINNTSVLGPIGANYFVGTVFLEPQMRIQPSLTILSFAASKPNTISNGSGTDLATGSGTPALGSPKCFCIQNVSGGSLSSSYGAFFCHFTASSEV